MATNQHKKDVQSSLLQNKKQTVCILRYRSIVITQLTQADREKLSRQHHMAPFRTSKKTIRNWLSVPFADESDPARIMPSVRKSYESVLFKAKRRQG